MTVDDEVLDALGQYGAVKKGGLVVFRVRRKNPARSPHSIRIALRRLVASGEVIEVEEGCHGVVYRTAVSEACDDWLMRATHAERAAALEAMHSIRGPRK